MLSLHHCWHLAKDVLDGYDGYGVGYGGGGPKYGAELVWNGNAKYVLFNIYIYKFLKTTYP